MFSELMICQLGDDNNSAHQEKYYDTKRSLTERDHVGSR